MRRRSENIRYERDYSLIAFDIFPQGADADRVKEIINEVEQHGADTRDTDGEERDEATLLNTRYLGILAERVITAHLRTIFGKDIRVLNRGFERYDTHVDIEIKIDEKKTDLEVRSSFGYAPIQQLIEEHFDHLGPYVTPSKPGEKPKKFYLRGLINKSVDDFDYKKEHTFYFAGGASYRSIKEEGKIKKGRRMEEIDIEEAERLLASENQTTLYRTLELWKGKDAVEIIDLIKRTIGAV
ncbi:MAG: hypothetical protein OXU51_06480 [Candidatus Poribacteria bacterium]|nr:hypothetical protein [Candidatus Poribacteria bacterium]